MLYDIGTHASTTERLTFRHFTYEDTQDMLTSWVIYPDVQSIYIDPTYTTSQVIKDLHVNYIAGS